MAGVPAGAHVSPAPLARDFKQTHVVSHQELAVDKKILPCSPVLVVGPENYKSIEQ